jgi:hypothetical protein
VPLGPHPERARAVLARLDALRVAVASGEEDVLATLVVTGEPRPQRVLDDWLDQVADTLRALGEAADRLAPPLARHAARADSPRTPGQVERSALAAGQVERSALAPGPPAGATDAPGIRPDEPWERAP